MMERGGKLWVTTAFLGSGLRWRTRTYLELNLDKLRKLQKFRGFLITFTSLCKWKLLRKNSLVHIHLLSKLNNEKSLLFSFLSLARSVISGLKNKHVIGINWIFCQISSPKSPSNWNTCHRRKGNFSVILSILPDGEILPNDLWDRLRLIIKVRRSFLWR